MGTFWARGALSGLAVAAGLAVGAGAYAVRGYARDASLVRWAPRRVTPAEMQTAAADLPGLAPVVLGTSDGLSLQGWFWQPPAGARGIVVLVHGGGGNRMQLFPEARALARHGYGLLVYDSRASGDSDGDLISWGDRERHDVAAAVDFVAARPGVDPRRIAVLGFSIGGSTVALETASDPRVSAVILYATWTSLEDEMKTNRATHGWLSWAPALARLRRSGVDVDAVRPIDAIAKISPRPLLMITGDRDDDTPVPVMRRLFEAAGPPKELWIVPGASHGGYYEAAPAEYEARVVSFLERAWARIPSP